MKQWQMHSIAKHGRDTLKFAACSSDGSLLAVVFADVSIGFHFFFFFLRHSVLWVSVSLLIIIHRLAEPRLQETRFSAYLSFLTKIVNG